MYDGPHLPKAIDVISFVNASVRNFRLYPPGSAIIEKSVSKAMQALEELMADVGAVTFAESEKNLIICDIPVPEREQAKPQVNGFISFMLEFGIRSLSFHQGLQLHELTSFFEIISRNPDQIDAEGGIQKLLNQAAFVHITIDHKLYVAMEQGQKIIEAKGLPAQETDESERDEKKEDIPQSVAAAAVDNAEKSSSNQVLHMGLQPHLDMDEAGSLADANFLASQLVDTLAGMSTPFERQEAMESAAKEMADQKDTSLLRMLAEDFPPEHTARRFVSNVIERMDDDQFTRIAKKVEELAKSSSGVSFHKGQNARSEGDPSLPPEDLLSPQDAHRAWKRLSISPRLQRLNDAQKTNRKGSSPVWSADFKKSMESFLAGDMSPLSDEWMVERLPQAWEQLKSRGRENVSGAILSRLTRGLNSKKFHERVGSAQAFVDITNKMNVQSMADTMTARIDDIAGWVTKEKKSSPPFETLFTQLKSVIQVLIRRHNYQAANRILTKLSAHTTGEGPNRSALASLANNVIGGVGTPEILLFLLEEIQAEPKEANRRIIIETLTLLNPASAELILDRLRDTKDRSLRSFLLNLYSALGNPARVALLRRLKKQHPWYYMRNLVSLLGKLGLAKDVEQLKPLLHMGDIRVRREAINSIYNIGGDDRGRLLSEYLRGADESLLPHVVTILGALSYTPAIPVLAEMLEKTTKGIRNSSQRDQLQKKICDALGRIGSSKAVPALNTVIQSRNLLGSGYSPEVKSSASKALKRIRGFGRSSQAKGNDEEFGQIREEPVEGRLARVDGMIANNGKEATAKKIADWIGEEAGRQGFEEAELLLGKLKTIGESAKTDIIRAEKRILSERSQFINPNHKFSFSDLYDLLTDQECNALFRSMSAVSFGPDQQLVYQGMSNDHLYFIHHGELKIFYTAAEREILLDRTGNGGLIGVDSFFHATVATMSVMTISDVAGYAVDRPAVDQWRKQAPGLESKLRSYSLRLDQTKEKLEQKGMDRRQQRRIAMDGKVTVRICNALDQPVGKPLTAMVGDLSIGGASFSFKSAKPDIGIKLLGRRLKLSFDPARASVHRALNTQATVTSANYIPESQFALHVRFDKRLDDSFIDTAESCYGGFEL